jgi:hypothetical protein
MARDTSAFVDMEGQDPLATQARVIQQCIADALGSSGVREDELVLIDFSTEADVFAKPRRSRAPASIDAEPTAELEDDGQDGH